ncbi:PDR/VanB family oxidoreductase (plasmid) [Embleya sp. NBC_00888]|uniref:PDR/VanB family oxidoreductase n=1 Tax=Embleya sp. NBC_00888 TaxID=2975960 RepID=UPI002F90B628|nr:PDR/VanB family oxidoreductase [Embleya sp. NBC_00888]
MSPSTPPTSISGGPSTAPPDLYGRERADRMMRVLTVLGRLHTDAVAHRGRRRARSGAPHPPTRRAGMLELVVRERVVEAREVISLRLTAPAGGRLPEWQPGAHLLLELPSGRRRHYSLCGDPQDRYTYRIAIRRLPDGGGGSVEMHDALPVGATLRTVGPRNAFPFAAEPAVLFLAGGIGITPILPMVRQAARAGLDWRLIHLGRTRASLPFGAELGELGGSGGRFEVRADDEAGPPDCAELVGRAPAGTAVYCCGPAPMLAGVRAAVDVGQGGGGLHFERFAPAPVVDGRPFELRLRRAGIDLAVPADRPALDVLREALPQTAYSCRQGFCGVCRVRVLAGEVDHRDLRLTDDERAAGAMLVCVSRAAEGERLVLDL